MEKRDMKKLRELYRQTGKKKLLNEIEWYEQNKTQLEQQVDELIDENDRLRTEIKKVVEMLRKVFQQACDWIHQDSGCPADVFDWGCPHVGENECQENAVECWEHYFLEKVRGE